MKKSNLSYTQFKENVLNKLADYKKDVLKIEESGIFRYRGKKHPKKHILPIPPGKSIQDIVKEYNVLKCLKSEDFLIEKDLHRYAHHLNSSQLMCYNFFRPYIIKEGSKTCPNDALIDLLSKYIAINKCDDAECQFEYVQGGEYEGEGTNFDFYLKSGGTEVFFEIKYTEAGFGKCDNDNRHEEKFKRIYAGLIDKCPAIEGSITFNDEFCNNYQLFRNSIRATGKNKYVIFIYEENNQYCKQQLDEFLEKFITDDYKNKNIIGITWQDFVRNSTSSHKVEFIQKYLS